MILLSRFLVFPRLQSASEKKVGELQLQAAKNSLIDIDRLIDEKIKELKIFSEQKELYSEKDVSSLGENNTQIETAVNKFTTGEWREINVTATNGLRIYSSEKKLIGSNIRDESEIFQEMMYKAVLGQGSVSEAYLDKFDLPTLAVSYPIKNNAGKISGIVIGKLKWDSIQDQLPLSDASVTFVIDDHGTLIATNSLKDRVGIFVNNYSKEPAVAHSLSSNSMSMTTEGVFLQGKTLLSHAKEIGFGEYPGNNWVIGIETPVALIFQEINDSINTALIILSLLTFSVLGSLVIFLIRIIINPIKELNAFVGKISAGDYSARFTAKYSNEIGSFGEVLNRVVERVDQYQKNLEFTINEKTEELQKILLNVKEKNSSLENTKKAMLSLLQDINTEKTNIALQRARIETILASIGDAVFATDVKGKLIIVNDALEKLLGYTKEQVIGEDYREFLMPKNDKTGVSVDIVNSVIGTQNKVELLENYSLEIKDGPPIQVSYTSSPIIDKNGKIFGVIVVVHDMTEERALEKAKDNFLSIAAHQLRTPLGSVRWNLEMLLGGDIEKLGNPTMEVLKQIEESNKRMIDLTNNLLDVSRIDQGRTPNMPENIEIIRVIKDSIKEVEPLSSKNNIFCTVDSAKPEIIAFVDPKKFREVIQNLVSNGVKYNKVGGKLSVGVSLDNDYIKIEIKDTGIGIPEEDQKRITEKFFRAKNAILSETEGTGLGLYVVAAYVESWGGKLTFESKAEVGTTFWITIPIIKK